jgi:hypothetical protein
MEFVNEHGDHPLLSQRVFVPFGRGEAIHQDTFCSFIRMHYELLHNVRHIEIHGLADIDIDRHLGHDLDDGEDTKNSIREIILDACDDNGLRLFHSIERTMKSDTIRAVFTKQNKDECNTILNELDTWLSAKFIEGDTITAFRAQYSVHVYISTIEERKTQQHVKFNAYAQHIAKRFCTSNPNKPEESFDTVPLRIPKQRINLSYAATTATPSPQPQPAPHPVAHAAPALNADVMDMSLNIPMYSGKK